MEQAAPIVQAFFHIRCFLEMAGEVRQRGGPEPPEIVLFGSPALLCLYRIR
jgi:hypothetical protein